LHPAELTVCCRLIRFSWHGASRPGEILRFSTVSLPEVQNKRGADVDFQAVWAHVSNQKLQVSPRGASDWWRESVRNSVSVHQHKIRGSAIYSHCSIVRQDGELCCPRADFQNFINPCLNPSPSEAGSTLDRGLVFQMLASHTVLFIVLPTKTGP